jgi:hypothetical protein
MIFLQWAVCYEKKLNLTYRYKQGSDTQIGSICEDSLLLQNAYLWHGCRFQQRTQTGYVNISEQNFVFYFVLFVGLEWNRVNYYCGH